MAYLSRDALVKTMEMTPFTPDLCVSEDECDVMNRARMIYANIFKSLPAADVRPVVRGEWIVHNSLVGNYLIDENEVYICSVCKAQRTKRKYNYCPNCGADMKEKK